MIHCMVNCRQMVGQKKAGLIQESLLSGLATLIPSDQMRSPQRHPNQNLSASPVDSPDITFGKENVTLVNYKASEIVDGAKRWDRNVGSTLRTGPLLSKGSQLGNRKRHSPYRKVADVREARRASLDRKSDVRNSERIFRKPAICSSTILSFRDDRRVITVPEKLMADDTTGKFAYISLDGRLVNGELATSAKSTGGGLGQQQAQVWEGFAPMQRVLVVAVVAAIAAVVKDKNSKYVDKLLKTVQEKDNEILSMRQQLSLTSTQSSTSPHVLALRKEKTKLTPLAAMTVSRSTSPMAAAEDRNTKEFEKLLKTIHEKDDEILSMSQKLRLTCKQSIIIPSVLTLEEEQTKLTPLAATIESRFFSPVGSIRPCSDMDGTDSKLLDFILISEGQNVVTEVLPDASVINKGMVLVETPSKGHVNGVGSCLQHEFSDEAEEAAKWYVNPMVLEAEDQYFDMCTPEGGAPVFACTPAVRGSLEWMALRSSFKKRDSMTSTPVPQLLPFAEYSFVSPAQMIATCDTKERSLSPKEEVVAKLNQDLTASRVLCASVILNLKKELVAALDTEVSRFRAAVLAGLEEGTDPVEAMHLALARCWHDIAPKALSDLGLSPSEFESYQLHHKLKGSRNLDNILKLEEGIQAWREYMKPHCAIDVSIRQPTKVETPTRLRRRSIDESSPSPDVVREDFQKLRATVLSASGAEVKITACIASPDRGGPRKCITFSAKSGHQGFGFPNNSSEYVADEVLGELDKAAAQVAEMEIQMKRLEQTIAEADAKRQEAEEKLVASMARDLENQATLLKENIDKTNELRLREVELAELESSHKIMLVTKNNEIVTLRGDCNQRDTLLHEGVVQPTITTITQRIAVLEDACRDKDSTIYELKQEILALKTKLHEIRTFQSPAMLRGRRSFMPFGSPVNDYTTAINRLHKQEFEIPISSILAPSNPVHQVFEDLQTKTSLISHRDRNSHSFLVQTFEQGIYDFKHDSLGDNYSQVLSSTDQLSPRLKHSVEAVSVDPVHHQCLQKGPTEELHADNNECSCHSIINTQHPKAVNDDDDEGNDHCKPKTTRNTLSTMQASTSSDGSSQLDGEDISTEYSALKQSFEDSLHQCLQGPKEEHSANKDEYSNHAVSNTQHVKAMDDDKHNDQWNPTSTKNAPSSMQATSPTRDGFSGVEQSGEGCAIDSSVLKQLLEVGSVDPLHQCPEDPKKEDVANKNEDSNHSFSNKQQAKAMDDAKHDDQWNPRSTRNTLRLMQATLPIRDEFPEIQQPDEEGGEIDFAALKQSLHRCPGNPEDIANKNKGSNHSICHTQLAMNNDIYNDQWNPKSTRNGLSSIQATSPRRDGPSVIEQSGKEGGEIELSALKQSLEAVSLDPLHQCLEGPHKEPVMDNTQFCNYSSNDTHQSKAMDSRRSNQEFKPKGTRNNLSSLEESASRQGFSGHEQSRHAVSVELSALQHSLEAISVDPQESTSKKTQNSEYCSTQQSKTVNGDRVSQECKAKRSRNDFAGCEQLCRDISRLSQLEAVSVQHFECPKREPLIKKNQYRNYFLRNTQQSKVMDHYLVADFKLNGTRDSLHARNLSQVSSSKDEFSGLEQLSPLEQSTSAAHTLHQHFGGPKMEALTDKNQHNSSVAGKNHQFKVMSSKWFLQEFKLKSTRDNQSSLQLLSSSRNGFPKHEHSCQAVLRDKESSSECGHRVPENTMKLSAFNHVPSKQPKASTEFCKVSTSSLNSTSNLNRVRASVTFTSSTRTVGTSRVKDSRASSKSTNNPKRMDNKNNSRTSPGRVAVKVLGTMAPNTPIKNRNASSMDLKGGMNILGGGDPASKENSATKRRRWV